MTASRTTVVPINGTKYQLKKLLPEVSSFILMRLLNSGFSAGVASAKPEQEQERPVDDTPVDGQAVARAIVFAYLIRSSDFEQLRFIQRACMQATARIEDENMPMPVMDDRGNWAITEVADDLSLVLQLTIEVLVWNLAGFFSNGGLGTLLGPSTKA